MTNYKTQNNEHHFGGPWTLTKLDALRHYLKAFNQALKNQPSSSSKKFKRIYIDAFAGSGRCDIKINGTTIQEEGSASIALSIEPAFNDYYLFDIDSNFIDELHLLKQSHQDKNIVIRQGDGNKLIPELIRSINWKESRAVMFLDPYALELDWQVLELISETKAVDLWYLFPLSATTRLLANDINKAHEDQLTRIFGSSSWRQKLYKDITQSTLIGDDREETSSIRIADQAEIIKFTKARLETCFPNVVDPLILKSKSVPLFALFFMSSNPANRAVETSNRIASHILKMYQYKRLKTQPASLMTPSDQGNLF